MVYILYAEQVLGDQVVYVTSQMKQEAEWEVHLCLQTTPSCNLTVLPGHEETTKYIRNTGQHMR